jgi:SAM-dependent methyltransferase
MSAESRTHSGGNKEFWQKGRFDNYDSIQSLVSEKKAEEQENVARIIKYFCNSRQIVHPAILDVGCGPGTPITLTKYVLDNVPDCTVFGADGSEEMIAKSNANLSPVYGERFGGFVSDFNSDQCWTGKINRQYDFIISSSALHYLSDQRRKPFFREVYEHLNDKGVFIATIAGRAANPAIGEMEQAFRYEYTFNKIKQVGRATNFAEFRQSQEAKDAEAKINWQSSDVWLSAIRGAGFSGAEIVWQVWVRTTFVAVK